MSRKTWVILAIVIIAVGAIIGIALSRGSCSPSDSIPQSQNATDFTLSAMTGTNVTLSELKGTPVVINFWSISCSWCRKQLPYLENVAQQSEGDVEVIAINVIDSAASVQSFFGDYEPAMIIALDNNGETFVNYCQNYSNPRGSIPFTLFVDDEGVVQYKRIGAFTNEDELRNTLHDVFGITTP
jgi:thiol-disulfide isomerase/thioredoxin